MSIILTRKRGRKKIMDFYATRLENSPQGSSSEILTLA